MEIGIKNTLTLTVDEKDTAAAHGSGTLKVFATPAMIALMEKTAMESVSDFLNEGEATVGTLINVKHISATPIGCRVTCESELIEVDGRRLVFKVRAFDNGGDIGEGVHERFIVKSEKFFEKTQSKLS